jgi:hypothetical protein
MVEMLALIGALVVLGIVLRLSGLSMIHIEFKRYEKPPKQLNQ